MLAARLDSLKVHEYLPFLARRQAELSGSQHRLQASAEAAQTADPQHASLPRLFCPGRLLYISRLTAAHGANALPCSLAWSC